MSAPPPVPAGLAPQRAAGLRGWLEDLLQTTWRRRGLHALSLAPLALLFSTVTRLRRTAYRAGLCRSRRLPCPVVVVGNRIAGGAGKTPTVLALIAHLRSAGWRPGVISRGHGGSVRGVLEVRTDTPAALCGDEPLLIHLRGAVPVMVGRDRVAAGEALLSAHPEVDLIVSDDGLQHLRLARDVEVVVFDSRGAGNGWPLPAGPLREPIDTAPRGRATLVLYNATSPSTPLEGHCARAALAGAIELSAWRRGEPASASALAGLAARPGRELLACAGVAQPQRFFALLREAGLAFQPLALADHARLDPPPWPPGEVDVILTEKDAVKLDPDRLARERPGCRVWVAPLDFQPDPAFLSAIDAALAPDGGPRGAGWEGSAPRGRRTATR